MKCQEEYLASMNNIIQLLLLIAVCFIFQDQIRLVPSTVKAGDGIQYCKSWRLVSSTVKVGRLVASNLKTGD